ncbi:DNA repair exonuclease, partial [Cylindrobasidium torrendii FP15055 ss-10]
MNEDDVRPPPTIEEEFPDDTIKILLATDNHIGYLERDPIRGQDSINTFREILQLAVKHDVDFVLLAGDLFHENKPTRTCLFSTMALLREYTLGDKAVQVELLSDPDEGKADGFSFPAVNYEDPNLNVAIPVFSIHGNHDDPQGAGAEGALCALDVLSVSGLMNYMGKIDLPMSDVDAPTTGIAVRPVLLRKGNTYVGMYGIGNVKDQRMHFELRSNRVRMFMPKNKDEWFNILLLHQNRVKHGPQESVPEGMFDDSINLVIWGHEHDCRILPEPVAGKNYYISQPGSSVATSLADGEALEKHVALLKIQGKDFQMNPIPLRTVRPFVIDEVVLSEVAEEQGFELSDQIAINSFLKKKVEALIEEANTQWDERVEQYREREGDQFEDIPRMLPLIRLKVDTTGVSEMGNPHRFGQEFQGRLANPREVLVFTRAKAARAAKVTVDQPELSIDDPNLSASEKLEKVRVSTLVKEFLAAQEPQLLGENGMADAIQMFVEKDDLHAIGGHVSKVLKSMLKNVKANQDVNADVDDAELEDALYRAKEQHDKAYAEGSQKKVDKGKGKAADEEDDDDAASIDSMAMDVDLGGDDDDFEGPAPTKKRGPARKAPVKKKATPPSDDEDDFEDQSDQAPKKRTVAKKAPAKKAPAKKVPARGKKKATTPPSDAEVIDIPDDDDIEEVDEIVVKKRTNRAAVLGSQTTKAKAPAKKKATAGTQSTLTSGASSQRPARAAAKNSRKFVEDSD